MDAMPGIRAFFRDAVQAIERQDPALLIVVVVGIAVVGYLALRR